MRACGRMTKEVVQNICRIGHLSFIVKDVSICIYLYTFSNLSVIEKGAYSRRTYLRYPFRRNEGSSFDVPYACLCQSLDKLNLCLEWY